MSLGLSCKTWLICSVFLLTSARSALVSTTPASCFVGWFLEIIALLESLSLVIFEAWVDTVLGNLFLFKQSLLWAGHRTCTGWSPTGKPRVGGSIRGHVWAEVSRAQGSANLSLSSTTLTVGQPGVAAACNAVICPHWYSDDAWHFLMLVQK